MQDVITRTIDARGAAPLAAYAALRARAPGRTSFLLEMAEPGEGGEQRSVIGFLAKRESALPPAANAMRDLAATAAQMPAAASDPAVVASCVADVLALLLFDALLPLHGVAPWPDQAFVGRELRDVASIVFDHAAGTVTIAAANANVVERVARVLAEAPPLAELAPAGGDRPEHLNEQPPSPEFAKQLARAQRRLSLGGVQRLRLGRTFTAPLRGADLIDVYRALTEAAPLPHRFFIELAESPVFPGYAAAGVGRTAVRLGAGAGEGALAGELAALFSLEAGCGAPAKDALAVCRDIGAGPLGLRGGALARVRPGGAVEVLLPEAHVTFEHEQLQTIGVADVTEGRDAAAHTEAAAADAAPGLAAIRRAHDAAAAREAG